MINPSDPHKYKTYFQILFDMHHLLLFLLFMHFSLFYFETIWGPWPSFLTWHRLWRCVLLRLWLLLLSCWFPISEVSYRCTNSTDEPVKNNILNKELFQNRFTKCDNKMQGKASRQSTPCYTGCNSMVYLNITGTLLHVMLELTTKVKVAL